MWIIYLLLLISNISIVPGNAGGTKFTELSTVMVIVEMDKAQKVLTTAKENSQRSISKDEIQKMLEKAKEVLGATVFCSSEVIN